MLWTKIWLVLAMNIIKVNHTFYIQSSFKLRDLIIKFGPNRGSSLQRHSRRNSLRLMFCIKIYIIHHPNRLHIWFGHHIIRTKCYLVSLIQCLKGKKKKKERNTALFLFCFFFFFFFEVVHSTQGLASGVIRVNHAEIPKEAGR